LTSNSDAEYFRQPSRASARPSDNVGLQILALQRLYRLVNQYFTDVLRRPTSALEVPDLHAMVKDRNVTETLRLCRLIITIAVQSEKKKEVIEKIQGLNEVDQSALMRALEVVS
jgi:protein HOOK3